ncbi:hypothetical protein KCMC57_up06960 [Kitasatospora sp. CMC57]
MEPEQTAGQAAEQDAVQLTDEQRAAKAAQGRRLLLGISGGVCLLVFALAGGMLLTGSHGAAPAVPATSPSAPAGAPSAEPASPTPSAESPAPATPSADSPSPTPAQTSPAPPTPAKAVSAKPSATRPPQPTPPPRPEPTLPVRPATCPPGQYPVWSGCVTLPAPVTTFPLPPLPPQPTFTPS